MKLDRALDTLYDVLSPPNSAPHSIDYCPSCAPAEAIQSLIRADARTVEAERLQIYAGCAMGTIGQLADYLYFLPRLLELALQNDDRIPSPDDLIRRLPTDACDDLAEQQWRALQRFLMEAARNSLNPETLYRLDEWLTAAAIAGWKLEPILAAIEGSPQALVNYYSDNIVQARKNKLSNAYWTFAEEKERQVIDWLKSDSVFQRVSEYSALF